SLTARRVSTPFCPKQSSATENRPTDGHLDRELANFCGRPNARHRSREPPSSVRAPNVLANFVYFRTHRTRRQSATFSCAFPAEPRPNPKPAPQAKCDSQKGEYS